MDMQQSLARVNETEKGKKYWFSPYCKNSNLCLTKEIEEMGTLYAASYIAKHKP